MKTLPKSTCQNHDNGYFISAGPWSNIDGLVQERRNSSALAMELRLSCTKPSIWYVRLPEGGHLLCGPYWGCAAHKGPFLSPISAAMGLFLARFP